MKKVLAFLEKNVQWVALGLGGLYLAYMIWVYVVQTPVVVTGIGPTPLNPGDVDPYIHDSVSTKLDIAMKDTSVPEMAVPNFIDRFKADMDFSDLKQWAMMIIPDSQVLPIQLVPTAPTQIVDVPDIKALPTLPPASVVDSSTGKSNIQFAPAAGVAGGGPGGVPGVSPDAPPAPSPALPPPGNNGAQVVAVAGNQDTSWVTVSYTIPAAQIAQAFKTANIPPWAERTSILEVHLWREEALPGGKWSAKTPIAPINAQALLPFPASNNPQDQQNFLTWAIAHVSDILQPAFFVVNKGDPWHAPGQIVAAAQPVAQQPLDPTQTYPLNVLKQYSQEDRRAYFQAHEKWKESQRPSGRRSAPPPDSAPPPPGPGGRNTPAIGSIGSEVYAAPAMEPVPPTADPNMPGAGVPPAPIPAAAAAAATPPDLATQFPIPSGEFDPNTLTTDITGWAHDVTVEAGHTYRYMVTYRIRNPIFGTNAAKNNPALKSIFDITSPDGNWSKLINVASTTNFFVYANSAPGGVPAARFKVYKWINGVERAHVFLVSPGDIIGGKDGDVDYSTGWTVVDLRFDDPHNPGSTTIIVMSPDGVLDRRDYKTDQAKPELNALDQQVSAATSADQLAGGANKP